MPLGAMHAARTTRSHGRRGRRVAAFLAVASLLGAMTAVVRAVGRSRMQGTTDEALVLLALLAGFVAAAAIAAWGGGGGARRVLGRTVLAVALPLGGLAVLELPVLLSGFDWRRHVPRPGDDLFFRLKRMRNPWNHEHAELVYTRPPGERIRGRTHGDCVLWLGAPPDREYDYDLRYDARGYRNETTLARADLAFVGDSFVEAALIDDQRLFTRRLAAELERPVANLGVGGYGPQQALWVLRHHALPLQPALVYWFFFEGNDLVDALRFEHDRLELAQARERKAGHLVRSFSASMLGLAACLLAPASEEDRARARSQSALLEVAGPDRGARLYFPYEALPLGPEELRAAVEVERMVREARDACAAAGSRLVLVFVPEKFRVYRELVAIEPGSALERWQPSDLPQRFAAFAAAEQVEWLDLTAPLQAGARAGPLLFFVDDGHWNPAGHELVARELAAHARRLLEGAEPR